MGRSPAVRGARSAAMPGVPPSPAQRRASWGRVPARGVRTERGAREALGERSASLTCPLRPPPHSAPPANSSQIPCGRTLLSSAGSTGARRYRWKHRSAASRRSPTGFASIPCRSRRGRIRPIRQSGSGVSGRWARTGRAGRCARRSGPRTPRSARPTAIPAATTKRSVSASSGRPPVSSPMRRHRISRHRRTASAAIRSPRNRASSVSGAATSFRRRRPAGTGRSRISRRSRLSVPRTRWTLPRRGRKTVARPSFRGRSRWIRSSTSG